MTEATSRPTESAICCRKCVKNVPDGPPPITPMRDPSTSSIRPLAPPLPLPLARSDVNPHSLGADREYVTPLHVCPAPYGRRRAAPFTRTAGGTLPVNYRQQSHSQAEALASRDIGKQGGGGSGRLRPDGGCARWRRTSAPPIFLAPVGSRLQHCGAHRI